MDSPRRYVENYIWTSNPFGLAKPPDWFLDQMFAYDAELRIFPSMNEPVYRIMRQVRTAQPWTKFIAEKPDTAVAIAHRLHPVMSILPQTILGFSWGRVLLELAERDQSRIGSTQDVINHIEGREAQAEARIHSAQMNETDARAGDMYRAMKSISGESVSLAYRAPEGVGGIRRATSPSRKPLRQAYRPSGSGAGAFFTGRGAGLGAKLSVPA
jgi:hypothetical protein